MRGKNVSIFAIFVFLPLIAERVANGGRALASNGATRIHNRASRTSPPAAQAPKSVLGVECSRASELGLERMMNVRAHLILSGCGLEKSAEPASLPTAPKPSLSVPAAPLLTPNNVNTITGAEIFPRVTQSESVVWSSNGQTVVVNYNDSRTSPDNYSGASVSINGGLTFTRFDPSPFATGHGTNLGDSILVYNQQLGMWFAGDIVTGCGGQGIGLWTSPNGINWAVGACAHVGAFDDRESMWVDNNPTSPFFGRMYISYNNFAVGGGRLEVTSSVNGVAWGPPVAVTPTFIRNVQLTGGPDGTVFIATMDEGGGQLNNRTNVMYWSPNGGVNWFASVMGPPFAAAGDSLCQDIAYFARVSPIWRQMGWGQPGVGPNAVVHYAYAGKGINRGDTGDIYYTQSQDNGLTWSVPIVLNTDQMVGGREQQWMPSLSVTLDGDVQVAWYDRRNTSDGQNYEYWGRRSMDNGATWLPDAPISNVLIPQPAQPDPNVSPCYAGDYNYHSALGDVHYATWTDGRNPVLGVPQQDVYFAQLNRAANFLDLKCYEIAGEPLNLTLHLDHLNPVFQQLGVPPEDVVLGEPRQLCVPVMKDGVLPPPEVLTLIQYVDLKCYAISGAALNLPVRLDHLNPVLVGLGVPPEVVTVLEPQQLCVPVAKDGNFPPPEVLETVQFIDQKCYNIVGDPLGLRLHLDHLNPVLQALGAPPEDVSLEQAQQLCVPVAKNGRFPRPDVLSVVQNIDQKCYSISGDSLNLALRLDHLNPVLQDLGAPPEDVTLRFPQQLCVPVRKGIP